MTDRDDDREASSDESARRRRALRKAESTFEDPAAAAKLAEEGIFLGEAQRFTGEEFLRMLDEEPDDDRPTLTVTCYFADTPVNDRGDIEDPLSTFVEDSGLGHWVGSGQGSMGERAFFDVTFAVDDLEKAVPRILEHLRQLGVGAQTTVGTSDGTTHTLT